MWFTKTSGKVDLAALREVIDGAQHAILFLMFMPGGRGVLPDVQRRQGDPGLVVRVWSASCPSPTTRASST